MAAGEEIITELQHCCRIEKHCAASPYTLYRKEVLGPTAKNIYISMLIARLTHNVDGTAIFTDITLYIE